MFFRKTHSIFFDFLGNFYILPGQLFWQTPLVECFWHNKYKCQTPFTAEILACTEFQYVSRKHI